MTGYIAEGLFSSQEEIDNWPDQTQLGSIPMPGDIKYRDVDGDGMITSEDQVMLSPYGDVPRIQYGLGLNIRWKRFDLGLFFNGSAKRNIMINSGYAPFLASGGDGGPAESLPRNMMQWIADSHWSIDNPNLNAAYPRLGTSYSEIAGNIQPSSYWMRNGNFIRFKTLEFGYSFPMRNWRNTNYETPGYGYELVSYQYDESKWQRALTACQEALSAAQAAGYQLYTVDDANQRATVENVPLPFIPGKEEDTEENTAFKERVRMLQYMVTAHEGFGNKELIWAVNNNDQYMMDDGMIKALIPNRCVKNSDGTWGGGYHGTAPVWAAVNRFYTENGLRPADDLDFYSESEWLTRYYEGTESPALTTTELDGEDIKNDIIKFNVGREPRYYAWIGFDGCEYMLLINNNNLLWLNLKNSNTNGYSLSNTRNATGTGFMNKKFVEPSGVYLASGSVRSNGVRIIMIRMAELYLNLAECYAALGNTDAALENLNIIRERAGIRDLTAADLSIMSLMDWVRNERSVEFQAEGHRYYDVRRWCIADQALQPESFQGLNGLTVDPTFEEFNQVVPTTQPIQWNTRQYLIPITNSELYSAPQLVQAPGY